MNLKESFLESWVTSVGWIQVAKSYNLARPAQKLWELGETLEQVMQLLRPEQLPHHHLQLQPAAVEVETHA